MLDGKKNIFTINCGSTSTKVALFKDMELLCKEDIQVKVEDIEHFDSVIEQLPIRQGSVDEFMKKAGMKADDFDIIVTRGGALPLVRERAFKVNQFLIDVMTFAPVTEHASSLSCILGWNIAKGKDIPVIIYDPASLDETDDVAKISGLPHLERVPVSHVLNTRKVARDIAEKIKKPYEQCKFIVVHLGGGVSVNAHREGRIVDFVCYDEAHMSPTRAGGFRTIPFLQMIYSGKYNKQDVYSMTQAKGGLMAHLGVNDIREVVKMIESGDKGARDVFYAMAYQISKSIGNLAVALNGNVDRIILTGGIAHVDFFNNWIREKTEFIAPMEVVAGEQEMEALAMGGLMVLNGKERAKDYDVLPLGCKNMKEFEALKHKR